jgi:dihydroneopterin aldolase
MKLTVELKQMDFYAYHGVERQETSVGNRFTVNVLYALPTDKACFSDDLCDAVSYANVYRIVKEEMALPSKLLEHVAGRIFGRLKAEFPNLSGLKLTVAKLNPPLEGGEVHSASVTLEE